MIHYLLWKLFETNKTEQQKLEWHFYWNVEFVDWWQNLWFVKLFNSTNQDTDDEDFFPF